MPTTITTLQAPEQLDPLTLPLTGQALIEASAGTGKTYTLAALYLRLLLGLGRENSLEVDQILVVTFTEAATQELRERIRSRIQEARIAFVLGTSEDPFIEKLLAQHPDHQRAVLDLEFAASEMDQASVFTIHGFCQRMLKQHAFESGANFNTELINDDTDIVRQALLDFWRTQLYAADTELAVEILASYSTPDKLLSKIRSYLNLHNVQLTPDYTDFPLRLKWQQFLTAQGLLRKALIATINSSAAEDDLLALIQDSSVDKRSYSKRYLPNWYAKLVGFAAGEKAPFKELLKFSQSQLEDKSKTEAVPRHPVFVQIAEFCEQQINFKAVIFCKALAAVRRNMQIEKQKNQQLSFDDLLHKLAHALQGESGDALVKAIRKQYPFALIDEFQDTDPEQYSIFATLYAIPTEQLDASAAEFEISSSVAEDPDSSSDSSVEALGLLMIGDPKQSIYAFRGADIFTYMKARQQVVKHYTLATNWRSSKAMINATNQLFGRSPAAFIYQQDIPFYPVSATSKASTLTINAQPIPALSFFYRDEMLNNDQYLLESASTCAAQIDRLLQSAKLNDQPVTPADIAVLVRDRKEAALVQKALLQVQVDSVFMSNRENVYTVHGARELQYILQAVNEPSNERLLRTALATELLQLNARELFDLNQDELAWEALVEEFVDYRKIWWRSGVLAMLHALLQKRGLAQRWLSFNEGERRLTDYLHLAELLQQASAELESNETLIRFLQDKRAQPANQSQEQQLRLDSDRSRVTVITIHKSKGLEYEIVYLPFACRYRQASSILFHDDAGQAILDLETSDNQQQIEKEQLAEDLRLLYVAITRAAQACFIGMANVCLRKKSVWQKTAIGYLLTYIKPADADQPAMHLNDLDLPQVLQLLTQQCDDIQTIDATAINLEQGELFGALIDDLAARQIDTATVLRARDFQRVINHQWRVTSYSALAKDAQHAPLINSQVGLAHSTALENDHLDLEVLDESELLVSDPVEKSIFSFAKGAVAGTFLHSIYEEIDFSSTDNSELLAVLEQKLPLSGYDLAWLPTLAAFIDQSLDVVLMTPSAEQNFTLRSITPANRLVEMEFILPFKAIDCTTINKLLAVHEPLSQRAGALVFSRVAGMLKGFIDLTVRANGQYYVIDYKSNYLGDQLSDYQADNMQLAMIDHRYDFQYVLYTLALHRLLRSRLADYDYDKDIGGVFYLFLRGMSVGSESGVFYSKPKRELIESLDRLFEGER